MPIKKRALDAPTLVPPDLPSDTKILKKACPMLVEFVTCRSYIEGGARVPGRFWFEPSGSGFMITLFDLDNAMKIAVRAGTIDDVFAACEVVLGAENAPWEPDQYQLDRRAQKGKKK